MTRKTILLILTIALVLFFLWTGFLWKLFNSGFAGSYPPVLAESPARDSDET